MQCVWHICCLVLICCDSGFVSGQACGSLLNGIGIIKSEGYPEKYPAHHDCTWTIEAGDSDTVILKFDDFNIEPAENCEFDSLTISNKGRLQRFCGDSPSDVSPNGTLHLTGQVVLRLTSDDSVQIRGINVQYEVVIDPNPPTTPVPTVAFTTEAATQSTTPHPEVTCDDEPCQNDAECVLSGNEVSCSCKDGFEGDYCEINIDECASNPCANGGTCVDGVNSWSCECVAGYTGETCAAVVHERPTEPKPPNADHAAAPFSINSTNPSDAERNDQDHVQHRVSVEVIVACCILAFAALIASVAAVVCNCYKGKCTPGFRLMKNKTHASISRTEKNILTNQPYAA